jgi:hypothetical protein
MKKTLILFAVAALAACSDSSDSQAPSGAASNSGAATNTEQSVAAAPAETTTTPKTDALQSGKAGTVDPALTKRWAELQPRFGPARDAFRETQARWREKDEELKKAVEANSPDVEKIKEEADRLRLAFLSAQEEFTPIFEEMESLKAQMAAQRQTQ